MTDKKDKVTTLVSFMREVNERYEDYRNGLIRQGEMVADVKLWIETVEAYELAELKRAIESHGYDVVIKTKI